MIGSEVEVVHRAGHVEIGINIEVIDGAHALVAQIALDLEISVQSEDELFPVLHAVAELVVQCIF
jgi:hypothetical protein